MDHQNAKNQRLLSPKKFAELLEVSPRTIYRRLADGSLRSVRFGGVVRIPATELERITEGVAA